MFRKRNNRQIPELNTTSTADISFMLLIFFLVTSSMDTDKGLLRKMAPPPLEHEQPMDVQKDLVMRVTIDADNQIHCDDAVVTPKQLQERVVALASVNREQHVISIEADPASTYETYFRMQDAIVGAYHALRRQYALKHYGHDYAHCSSEERAAVNEYYPQRISESLVEEGGRP
jgi:biopolymer transport protein ExbD